MLKVTSSRKKTLLAGAILAAAALCSAPILAQGLSGPRVLPAGALERFAAVKQSAGLETIWSQARDQALARAINPDDYECGATPLDLWFEERINAMADPDAFFEIAFDLGAWDWPFFYMLLFDHDASDEYIGRNGEHTHELKTRHQDAQRFWDMPTQDVLLQGMHGAVLADDAKMVPVVEFLFGVPGDIAQEIVDYVQLVIENVPGIGYELPLFSLNAFAVSFFDEPEDSPFHGFPDKIVMGDGIMEFFDDVGLGQNAPDMVHAHEFAHHIQYELGLFDATIPEEELPEFTRRTELMADAFAGYFAAHARGAAMQTKRILEVVSGSYMVGDCAFAFPGHHGTPNQRQAAARWGAELAESAKKQGAINSSSAMLAAFELQLPIFLAPDAN